MYACIAFVGIIVSLFIKKNSLTRNHEVTKTGLDAQQSAADAKKEDQQEKETRRAAKRAAEKDPDLEAASAAAANETRHEPKE